MNGTAKRTRGSTPNKGSIASPAPVAGHVQDATAAPSGLVSRSARGLAADVDTQGVPMTSDRRGSWRRLQGLRSGGESDDVAPAKRLRFDLAHNIVWTPGTKMPAAEMRTPPTAKPKVSAIGAVHNPYH